MTLQQQIREHLEKTGLSQRGLALQAGLNPKAVWYIFNVPGTRPTRATLDALGAAMGVELVAETEHLTYARLIDRLSSKTGDKPRDKTNSTRASRLRKLLRVTGWSITETIDRRRVIDFFANSSGATFEITNSSLSTYKSDILAAIPARTAGNRAPGMRDVAGLYREIYDTVKAADLPDDMKLVSGSFFSYLDGAGLLPSQISTEVLHAYYIHRLEKSPKTEAVCKKHVKRIVALCRRLAVEPACVEYGFSPVDHPFADERGKYGVTDAMFGTLLDEFDGPVTQWLHGKQSRDGKTYKEFLIWIDAEPSAPVAGKKSLLKKKGGRKVTDEERRSAGFLCADECWADLTIMNRRSALIAGAKALYAATGYHIETIAEYTDPDVVENVLDALRSANSGSALGSSYTASVGKAVKKLARDYVGRNEAEIAAITKVIEEHHSGKKGIAERNKAKLRQLVGERQQRLIDLGDILADEVNRSLDILAKKCRRSGRTRVELIDAEIARDVMCAVASDILLARAPRRANLTNIRLNWISWYGNTARITIPSHELKLRDADDPDLPIPLDEHASARLRLYLDKIRPKTLCKDDDDNPHLFPAQGSTSVGAAYVGLLDRLMRHSKRIVGIQMNPHLYRHFVGWLWLKEDSDRLPDVQRLLGHKSLETTLAYYAEIDEELALERWQAFLAEKKSRRPRTPGRDAR